MILKDVDHKNHQDKFQKYGYEAERQMAFYLKRAFQDNQDIYVINDLRLEMNDDVAQIDHLIVHPYGFILIESKSVTSEISINELGEWTRHYPTFSRGMPSPINQARTQAEFLKNYLTARSEYLLKKKLIFKFSFSDFNFDVLVGISDSGIINRESKKAVKEVLKADQIPGQILNIITGYSSINKSLLTTEVKYQFSDETIDKITEYLLTTHKPQAIQTKKTATKNNKITANPINSENGPEKQLLQSDQMSVKYICSKCDSSNVEIRHGKYGYYFKCKDCDGNTAIKLSCKTESCKPKIRKDKLQFFKDCKICDTSELFFVNASQ